MLTETTITKLREMRLSVMTNALKDQLEDSQYRNMAFEDRLGLIVDAEWNARKSNHLQKLIREATFSDPTACVDNRPCIRAVYERYARWAGCENTDSRRRAPASWQRTNYSTREFYELIKE